MVFTLMQMEDRSYLLRTEMIDNHALLVQAVHDCFTEEIEKWK